MGPPPGGPTRLRFLDLVPGDAGTDVPHDRTYHLEAFARSASRHQYVYGLKSLRSAWPQRPSRTRRTPWAALPFSRRVHARRSAWRASPCTWGIQARAWRGVSHLPWAGQCLTAALFCSSACCSSLRSVSLPPFSCHSLCQLTSCARLGYPSSRMVAVALRPYLM